MQNCLESASLAGRFDKEDWDNWLKTIKLFFNSYKISSILHTKPLGDSRPYVNIKINDITASGLLDSGAAITILGNNSHDTLLSRGLKLCTDDTPSIVAAGGQILKSIGYINVPVHLEDQFHIIKSYVVPEVQSSLILGIDFWRAFHLCPKYLGSVDFSNNSLVDLNSNNHTTFIQSYDSLDESQRAIADNVVEQFRDISYEIKGLGRTHLLTHRIDTGDSPLDRSNIDSPPDIIGFLLRSRKFLSNRWMRC